MGRLKINEIMMLVIYQQERKRIKCTISTGVAVEVIMSNSTGSSALVLEIQILSRCNVAPTSSELTAEVKSIY
jgi:hypothetical protein